MRTNFHVQKYLWRVRRALVGSGSQKREILSTLTTSVWEFVSENQNADYQTIAARFGPPRQIAESYVAEMEPADLLERMRVRRRILRIVGAAAAAMLITCAAFFTAAYLTVQRDANGFAVVDVHVIDRTPIDEGRK